MKHEHAHPATLVGCSITPLYPARTLKAASSCELGADFCLLGTIFLAYTTSKPRSGNRRLRSPAVLGSAPHNFYDTLVRQRRLNDSEKFESRVRTLDQIVPLLSGTLSSVEHRKHSEVTVSLQCQRILFPEAPRGSRLTRNTHLCLLCS